MIEKPKAKVFVVGIDGGSFSLVQKWAESGELPVFKKILEEGASGTLTSTMLPVSSPAWPCFMTGVNPGKLGFFDFIVPRKGSYQRSIVNSEMIRYSTLWEILSKFGFKVGVINVPVTYPPREVNGFLVSGLLTPSRRSPFTYPASLQAELLSQVPDYTIEMKEPYIPGQEERFVYHLNKVLNARIRAMFYLMENHPFDFFCIVFRFMDFLQEKFWHFMESDGASEEEQNSILNAYKKLDQILGVIISRLSKGTTVIVMSDHGMGPLRCNFLTNRWLQQEGFLHLKSDFLPSFKRSLSSQLALDKLFAILYRTPLTRLSQYIPETKRWKLVERLNSSLISLEDIDWRKTIAYSVGHFGQIYLNVKGREPEGIVAPGKEYRQIRRKIVDRLRIHPIIKQQVETLEVFTKEELYFGERIEFAPDIVFVMDNFSIISSQKLCLPEGPLFAPLPYSHSATHRREGMLFLWGDNIKAKCFLKGAKIYDLAPTVLYLMGKPIPEYMDGKVLEAAIEDSFRKSHPLKYCSPNLEETESKFSLTDKERQEIEKRLRNLGYLG